MRRRTVLTAMAAGPLAALAVPMSSANAAARRTGFVVGNVAPDLELLTPTGASRMLSGLRGNFVVLDMSTMWCERSQAVARELRPFIDSVNAPKALKAPLVWIASEFDAFEPGVAPTPGQLVRFGLRYRVGDPRSPMAWFGEAGSATYEAGKVQLNGYASANGLPPGFPTFVVLDPAGVVLAVFTGFIEQRGTPAGYVPTMTQIGKAIRAKQVPFQPTVPPYTRGVLEGVDVSATVDGSPGSVTVRSVAEPADLGNGYVVDSFLGSAAEYTLDVLTVLVSRPEYAPFDPASTVELSVGNVVWQSTGVFESLTPVLPAPHLKLLVSPSDGSQQLELATPLAVDPDGHVGPFVLQDVLDGLAQEIDAMQVGPVDVVGLWVDMLYDGPVASTYGQ